jgi:hypothetical protein
MDKKHEVHEHELEETKLGDHYHDIHHFYGEKEDDVKPSDFSPKNFFKKKQTNNTIFYISATGIFLALAIVASLIDIGLEMLDLLIPPINGIPVMMRFLDVLVVMLAVTAIGPIFASVVALITPFLHAVIHGEIWNPYEPLFDAVSYILIVWILWLFFYVVFRNSLFHRHPNDKVDKFRRWTPMVPFILISSAVFTIFYILTIYITTVQGHSGGDHEESISFDSFKKMIWINVIIVFCANIIRCTFDMTIFCLIEPKLKIINHRYY